MHLFTNDKSFQVIVRSASTIFEFEDTHLNNIHLKITARFQAHLFVRKSIDVLFSVDCVDCSRLPIVSSSSASSHHRSIEPSVHLRCNASQCNYSNDPSRDSWRTLRAFFFKRQQKYHLAYPWCDRERIDLQSKAFSHTSVSEWLGFDFHRSLTRMPCSFDRIEFMSNDSLFRILINFEIQPTEQHGSLTWISLDRRELTRDLSIGPLFSQHPSNGPTSLFSNDDADGV